MTSFIFGLSCDSVIYYYVIKTHIGTNGNFISSAHIQSYLLFFMFINGDFLYFDELDFN